MSFLLKPLAFFLIIILGYLLMRFGFFKEGHQHVVSKIVLNITLPCAAVQAFGNAEKDNSLLVVVLVGFLFALIPTLLFFLLTVRCDKPRRIFYILNSSGYNLGCFTLPMLQSFFGAFGGVLVCIYDMGNAILATGGNYAIVSAALHTDGERVTPLSLVKRFLSSVSLDTYLIMLVLMVAGIPLPEAVLTITEPVGNANSFLAMLMLGMMIRPPQKRQYVLDTVLLLAARLGLSVLFSLAILWLVPLPLETRQILAIIPFAPIGALAVVFTHKCGGDGSLAGFTNTISVIIGLILMPLLCIRLVA